MASSTKAVTKSHAKSPWVAALLSLIIPGLGQVWRGEVRRGIAVFLTFASALITTLWYGVPSWYLAPIALWVWNIWDAIQLPKGAPIIIASLIWLVMAYGIGWQVTQINMTALFSNPERAASILRPMLNPDFIATRENVSEYWVPVQVPCSLQPPKAEKSFDGVHIVATPDCANINEAILVMAEGLRPNFPTEISWITSTGGVLMLGENHSKVMIISTDEEGRLSFIVQVPSSAQLVPDPSIFLMNKIGVTQRETLGGITISNNGKYIIQGIFETLALALLATIFGAIFAFPLSFLAARNLMSSNPFSMIVYTIVRTFMNIFRSIEALIMAIIFVVIVGLGPFPGMLALTVHTIAALGKLYSEVIEGIDPGPIEAVHATGATWMQVVRYAVIPQIVPPFTALTIYRWDINVRSSTIIGFVGGGGIGFYLWQWILLGDYRAVSAAFIAIAIVIIIMDFFSAKLRAQIM